MKRNQEWFDEVPSYSYGAEFADLDNDGDLDYVVNNLNDEAFLYKNNTIEQAKEAGNYLRIYLKGKESNSLAIGAKVELWRHGNYQYQEHFLSKGYASSVDHVVHFGLSQCAMVVHDFNRDSYPDVILAGNDHSYDISTGYYEANKGILLMSKNGKPLSDLQSSSQTGFMLHGMVGSLLFMEGDTPLVVAGLNRKKASVFSLTKAIEK